MMIQQGKPERKITESKSVNPRSLLDDGPRQRRGESDDAFFARCGRFCHERRFDLELERIQHNTPNRCADLPVEERRALARAYAHSLGLSVTSVAVSK